MGQTIRQVVDAADGVTVSGIWTRGESLDELVADSDVLIDFSLPEANAEVLAAVQKYRRPLVCGVSGLDGKQMASLERAAGVVPIVFDRNMSQGVSVLADLVQRAAKSLGPEFAAEIHEVHHVHKIDSPSGTALKLGEAIEAARAPDAAAVRYEAERRGEVPGDHTVILSSPTETLSLKHSVTTREVFAEGAVRAARWALRQAPGRYRMRDVLFDDG
jgi:4-hydroxy-tetrahydrodipicolinate reductase